MELVEFYRIEALWRQAEIDGDPDLFDRYSREINEKTRNLKPQAIFNSNAVHDVFKTEISQDLIEDISHADLNETHQEIDLVESFCRSYVEQLLDVDLSTVQIIRAAGDFKHAEGKALSRGAVDHLIFLPPVGEDYMSPDLLVHELGHTAEFMLRRAGNEFEMLWHHKLLSEAIAHYCQYKYMLEFCTPTQRLVALGSVTKDHMLLRALLAYFNLPDRPGVFEVCRIIDHEYLDIYRTAYTRDRIEYLLADYDGRDIAQLYFTFVEPRMGAILALHLINNCAAIRALCLMKTDSPIREMLDRLNLNTNELMDFTQADALFKQFVAGALYSHSHVVDDRVP